MRLENGAIRQFAKIRRSHRIKGLDFSRNPAVLSLRHFGDTPFMKTYRYVNFLWDDAKAKSLDPVKVAQALEGMEFEVFSGGKGFMRKDDHQFFQPMYIASFGDRTDKEPFDEEKTGWGWRVAATIDTAQTVLPTTCKMERPK